MEPYKWYCLLVMYCMTYIFKIIIGCEPDDIVAAYINMLLILLVKVLCCSYQNILELLSGKCFVFLTPRISKFVMTMLGCALKIWSQWLVEWMDLLDSLTHNIYICSFRHNYNSNIIIRRTPFIG